MQKNNSDRDPKIQIPNLQDPLLSESSIPTLSLWIGWGGLVWSLLEIATMLTNSKRRALHDLIAGTVVVRVSQIR